MSGVALAGAKAVVTGASGFIGAHLAARLCELGAEVVGLDRREPKLAAGQVRHVPLDLRRAAPAELDTALAGADAIFHLAAEKHAGLGSPPLDVLDANVRGTWLLLDGAARAGVRRVVYTSSLFAYGRTGLPAMREDEVPRPTTVYGISKLAGEHLMEHARTERGLDTLSLRLFFVYGPGQRQDEGYQSVMVRTFTRLLDGLHPTVFGDGRQALDYVYVADVVEALLAAMERGPSGALLNVGTGHAVEVGDLFEHMLRAWGHAVPIERLPPDRTAGTVRVADATRVGDVLGWRPRVSLPDGLVRTLAWLREAQGDRP